MSEDKLAIREAYEAAYIFFEQFYLRGGKPEQLAILLAGMQLIEEGKTEDPAFWFDWEKAVEKALGTDTKSKS